MTSDVYGAWLTAGNTLQPLGAWLSSNWPSLAIAAGLAAYAAWSLRRAARQLDHLLTRNDQHAATRTRREKP